MSVTALHTAATGLSALNTALEVTANNLANVNTNGFKASRVNFQDLLYIDRGQAGVAGLDDVRRPIGTQVGLGVRVTGTQLSFREGSPIQTDRELDLTIDGLGFFQVEVQDDLGERGIAYTRAGNFTLNSEGQLVLASDRGRVLTPVIDIPPDAITLTVTADGTVFVSLPGVAQPQEQGQIQLATFVNPSGLKQVGETLFVETEASGVPVVGEPGQDNFGQILQGFVEGSNVDPTSELIELIRAQRAFEINSNTIRAADETLRTISTTLRR
ncbi:MAG: flagellar basal-body rod protein FlgG [Planctomyces sp.]|nr:flagellar basal-body rod protein FlgG [Planctomyces sp.]MBA4039353.1 flagellar basal-body rod protein FlgG [Planctomyces sp.]MBA4119873.1 flagellar basal-body rod protein FlgG [Isosphaera sp.]